MYSFNENLYKLKTDVLVGVWPSFYFLTYAYIIKYLIAYFILFDKLFLSVWISLYSTS